jgi:hypothetical protein
LSGIELCKPNPLLGDSVDTWCFDDFLTVTTDFVKSKIIRKYENDIWFGGRGLLESRVGRECWIELAQQGKNRQDKQVGFRHLKIPAESKQVYDLLLVFILVSKKKDYSAAIG